MEPLRSHPIVAGAVALLLSGCSTGGGDDSSASTNLPATDHVHALRAADDGSLLLGLHGALWRSPDGLSWEELGLEGQDAMALGVAVEGQPLVVGGHDVLARSEDGGESFDMLAPPDLPSLDIHALAQAPSDPRTVYAYVVGYGIYRSPDAGDTWEPGSPVGGEVPGDLAAMAVDPEDPQLVLVGSGGHGVFRSTDGAETFTQVTDWGTLGLAFAADGTVLAATFRGIDVSQDAGRTWDNATAAGDLEGQPLAVAIGSDGTWWVMTEDPRVLYRDDGGHGDFVEVARA